MISISHLRENRPVLLLAALLILLGALLAASTPASFAIAGSLGALMLLMALARVAYGALERLRLAEAETRAIVERAADGIVTTDEFGNIETVNKAGEAIFGYRYSELAGHRLGTLLSSVYNDPEGSSLWEFLRANAIGMAGAAQEVIGLRRNGDTFFMDLTVSQAQVAERSIFIAVVHDITEKKRSELALRQAHDLLEQRVHARTADLQRVNEQLVEEIQRREQIQRQQSETLGELQQAMKDIKTLSGMIPICASCKKVRNDDGFWNQIEEFISDHSDAMFSHGICPDCKDVLYPDLKGV